MRHGDDVKLLLVEDNDIDVKIFERAMRKAGIDRPTRIACDGKDALDILRGAGAVERLEKPNVVVLDLNMPRMDGLQFLAEVRADPYLHNLVVFVLTTSDAPSDRQRAYEHNIAGYLLKSLVREDFLASVRLIGNYIDRVRLPLH